MLAVCMALIDEPTDREKFMDVYNTYKDIMLDVAMSILKNNSIADEIVQDSFFKIAANITDIGEVDSIKTASYVTVITKNAAINRLKEEHIEDTVPLDETYQDISEDVLSKAIFKEGQELLISEINKLDDMYNDVLILKFAFGYDNESISQMLKLPKRTVETRIYRGKKKLQEKLEGYYGKDKINI